MTRFGSERTDHRSDRQKRTGSWSSSWKNEPNSKRGRYEDDTFEPQLNRKSETSTRTMLTYKRFLETLDDSISDEEAIARYTDYKFEFRKQEYDKFFEAHKDDEWFQFKYHPELSKASSEQQQNNLKKRLEIYNELVTQNGFGKELRLDVDNCENLIRFMDSVVIKLEDGTAEDVELMLQEPVFDEAIDEVKKKLASDANGNGEQKNGNGETLTNGATKTEAAEDESEPIKELLKRVPYKTNSIFFRNIPSTAKHEEIENECKNFPGFLRIGFSEPLNDQNFARRLWASFRRDVKIKEIFWNIKNAKFVDADTQPSVNRDLRRRVRTIEGIAHHRPIVQNDIRQAARLIAIYDHKRKLFIEEEQTDEPKDLDALVGRSKNPILDGVFEYFVEESNAEEEELLGVSKQTGDDLKFPIEVDKTLIAYLDKLAIYLRVVHSIDYYNHVEYGNEDSMPNRMGMIHVRDFQLTGDEHGKTATGIPLVPKKTVDTFISKNDERLKSTILKFKTVSESDLKKLGQKDPDQAVEAFIQENCVELSKDKWLCPISGKKFKGPEFIRKHLFSKLSSSTTIFLIRTDHTILSQQNLQQLRKPPANEEPRRQEGNWNDRSRFGGSGSRFNNNRFSDFGRNRGSGEFGTRKAVSYRDLDAPDNNII
ncbi:Arsenite-resistance protein 2-like protein [Aphelenchoides bicaudatus]|nr:Arsenite-resistance protein 2-like protein [Aphelenchoides bicaudatus]